MKKLLMLAIAVMAFALPASASAEEVFTYTAIPIGHSEQVNAEFSGPAAFVIPGTTPQQGIHCGHVTVDITLEGTGRGTVKSFVTRQIASTTCTTTPDNFVAHTEPTNLPWDIHTDGHDTITITGVEILNRVTHPATPHLVIALRELTGNFHATIPGGQTVNINTLSLSGQGSVDLFPGSAFATVSGDLEKTSPSGAIGSATVGTE